MCSGVILSVKCYVLKNHGNTVSGFRRAFCRVHNLEIAVYDREYARLTVLFETVDCDRMVELFERKKDCLALFYCESKVIRSLGVCEVNLCRPVIEELDKILGIMGGGSLVYVR